MDAEFKFHLDSQISDYISQGLSRKDAEQRARREFGAVELAKDECRDQRPVEWLADLLRDVGYASRSMRRTPGFMVTAIVTLALGIGANTAIFSVMNATLFRPLRYKNPNQIVLVGETERDGCCWHGIIAFSAANFLDFKEQNQVFEYMATFEGASFTLTRVDNPEYIKAGSVTADFFNVLAVQPVLGQGDVIIQAVKIFGIGYVVKTYGSQINDGINTLMLNNKAENKLKTKVVPILSVGIGIASTNPGAYIGAAQVQGPAAAVNKVEAVAQIEGALFDAIRLKGLVPVDSLNPIAGNLHRVYGVGVTALVDFRI